MKKSEGLTCQESLTDMLTVEKNLVKKIFDKFPNINIINAYTSLCIYLASVI